MPLNEENSIEIAALLCGRKIISAGEVPYPYDGMLVLDDGTELFLTGNEGCGGCEFGHYDLTKLNTVDNIITSAGVVREDKTDETIYRIYVIADNTEINVAVFEGDDGNEYYGTGFTLLVREPISKNWRKHDSAR